MTPNPIPAEAERLIDNLEYAVLGKANLVPRANEHLKAAKDALRAALAASPAPEVGRDSGERVEQAVAIPASGPAPAPVTQDSYRRQILLEAGAWLRDFRDRTGCTEGDALALFVDDVQDTLVAWPRDRDSALQPPPQGLPAPAGISDERIRALPSLHYEPRPYTPSDHGFPGTIPAIWMTEADVRRIVAEEIAKAFAVHLQGEAARRELDRQAHSRDSPTPNAAQGQATPSTRSEE